MRHLSDIQGQLRELTGAIARLERALADHPLDSLLVNIRSLQKRQHELEGEFTKAAALAQSDVCTYRLFADGERETISGLSSVLGDFQSLFTVIYDALKHGPKRRAVWGSESALATSLGFAYTFGGSLGIVMTVANEKELFDDTPIDLAMKVLLAMSKAETPSQIARFAERLGPAPVRAMYKWATDHVSAGLGADIQWRREDRVKATLLIQDSELRRLKETIATTSDQQVETVTVVGRLVAADVEQRRFRLKVDKQRIRGFYTDAISLEQTVELPKMYRATLRKTTVTYYSTEQDQVTYELLSLEPPA
jgi:hypothetical protein